MNRFTFFRYYWSKELRWVRIFGYGFYAKPIHMPLSYNERNGYTKLIKIGKWYFGFLKPIKF